MSKVDQARANREREAALLRQFQKERQAGMALASMGGLTAGRIQDLFKQTYGGQFISIDENSIWQSAAKEPPWPKKWGDENMAQLPTEIATPTQAMQTINTLRAEVKEKNGQVVELTTYIEEKLQPARIFGAVLNIDKKDGFILLGTTAGQVMTKTKRFPDLKVSDIVIVDNKSGAIEVVTDGEQPMPGKIGRVVAMHKKTVEVEIDGQNHEVLKGGLVVETGARVKLDPSNTSLWRVMQAAEQQKHLFAEETHVTWESIGGADEAKAAMRDAIELPITHADLFHAYGKKAPKGVLLAGPPGCGKTMLAKAAATAIGGHGGSFFFVKGAELLSKWVGESESSVRELFNACRKQKQITGKTSVLFIDEAEALLSKRGTQFASMSATMVPSFLAEMDGIEDSGCVVVLATNRPEQLDPAVVREGRIDRKVTVKRPTQQEAVAIATIHLAGVLLAKKTDRQELAECIAMEMFDKRHVYHRLDGSNDFTFAQLVSGASIAGVIERASSIAIHRDIASKSKAPSGVSFGDVVLAVNAIVEANKMTDYTDDLESHMATIKNRANVRAA